MQADFYFIRNKNVLKIEKYKIAKEKGKTEDCVASQRKPKGVAVVEHSLSRSLLLRQKCNASFRFGTPAGEDSEAKNMPYFQV